MRENGREKEVERESGLLDVVTPSEAYDISCHASRRISLFSLASQYLPLLFPRSRLVIKAKTEANGKVTITVNLFIHLELNITIAPNRCRRIRFANFKAFVSNNSKRRTIRWKLFVRYLVREHVCRICVYGSVISILFESLHVEIKS